MSIPKRVTIAVHVDVYDWLEGESEAEIGERVRRLVKGHLWKRPKLWGKSPFLSAPSVRVLEVTER